MQEFVLKPIGLVHNSITMDNKPDDWSGVVSKIKIYSRYSKALYRISQFRTILVVFWFHEAAGSRLRVHPRGDKCRPVRGVFATRSQRRPNRLGVTEVELLKVSGNTLTVRGLDAFNGTPVVDIKSARIKKDLKD
jgi:tRNA-Thr(GGU) m(6)t(6)A37 methyltransferase TsaA